MAMNSKFRELLKQEFEARTKVNSRFSLRSFARMLDLAPSTVHQYLTGKYHPTSRNLDTIAAKLRWTEKTLNPLRLELNRLNKAHPDNNTLFVDDLTDEEADILVHLKLLADRKSAKGNEDWLMEKLNLSPERRPQLRTALAYLQERGVIECSEEQMKTVRRVKIVTDKAPRGTILDIQKHALKRFETALTEVPKKDRLVLIANFGADPKDLPAIAKEMNRFSARLQKLFGQRQTNENYQLVCGFIPIEEST